MSSGFDKAKIAELYPEAEELMIEPMLIWKLPSGKEQMLSEMCSNGDYFLEEKIDGAFYQFVKTEHYSYLFGRTVSKTSGILTEKSANVPHIKEAFDVLPAGTILIGEIYVPGGTSKDTVSIMGCLPALAIQRQKDAPIHYYVHDIIAYDGVNLQGEGAESRYDILQAIWKLHEFDKYDFLRLAVKVEENLEEEISHILKNGGEGAVLKKRDYPYAPGKRPAWSTIKVKQMDSIDLVCTGLCNATKEYTGKELETWQYWAIEKKTELGWIEEKLINGSYEAIRDINHRTIPITKPYYLGWKTAISIGAYNDDGELIDLGTVSSGLTDEIKQSMTENPDNYIGAVVSLDCMSIDKKEHTLRHPVFKSWRQDKNAQECKISEVFK